MQYLTLKCDYYLDSCLTNEFESSLFNLEDKTNRKVITLIQNWHSEYFPIIMMTEEERKKNKVLIQKLDKEGLEIADYISKNIQGGAKIKYFSEGQGQYLYSK